MINLVDLKAEYQAHRDELEEAMLEVATSGIYLFGPQLAQFEEEFSHFIGTDYAVGVHSGTDALMLALRALRLQPKDDVVIPANSYPTAFGVISARVHLRLCDVDPKTLNVSLDTLLPVITKRTKAIVVVHLFGMPAPIKEISEFAKKHHIYLIEDCAQATGAAVDNQRVGSFGDMGCFSFYPTKNLSAMGDGGAITTNSRELAQAIKRLRMYGEDARYHSLTPSNHSRLDEFQAAILRVRLAYVDQVRDRRLKLMARYRWELQGVAPVPEEIPRDIKPAWHLCVVRTNRRDNLKEYLWKRGIETAIHYPIPVHLQPAFRKIKYSGKYFPVSERACQEVLTLPFHTFLSPTQQDYVIKAVNSWK